ncbi:MAG: ATP-grasp domain-containing protein [Oligoflexales bacterium]|jgi:glutathione synthase/RimK-type ligase-like ATP-grasp enzyme|nr:ATP-grasp domain-containing protein [Oligoflexales bacterium]
MKFLIFSRNPDARSYKRIINEAENRKHKILITQTPDLDVSTDFSSSFYPYREFDLVHVLSGNKFLNQNLNRIFANMSIAVVNKNLSEFDTHSKLSQMSFYSNQGIPVPKTIYTMNPAWHKLTATLGADFVGKPINGSKGDGVVLIKSQKELEKIEYPSQYIFQAHIINDGDYRVHVFGGEACCLYKRVRKSGFVNNVSQGAVTEVVTNSLEIAQLVDLAKMTAQVGGFDYVGVDIVRSLVDGKLYVLETNSAPGMYDVQIDSGEDYAVKIIDFYEKMVLNK